MKQRAERIKKLAQSAEERIQLTRVLEKADTCREKCYVTSTRFLDMREAALAEELLHQSGEHRWRFVGGHTDAERRVIVFLPDYLEELEADSEDMPITAIRCTKNKADTLTHRDYLGSLMGLQIKRECIGDILIGDHGADIVVLKEIAPFLLLNYTKAGRKNLSTEEIPLSRLIVPVPKVTHIRDTVASLRLDAVCASLFRIPRTRAVEAIKGGRVFLNQRPCMQPDREIREGDKITLRGLGRGEVDEILGESRKKRIVISLKKFV
ncbi:MAG: YlmH/Sll1252 family protein [Eubacteriales bacterium]|nr:YlmH/Sll1252 family protein [Eubacteriales bacterium]